MTNFIRNTCQLHLTLSQSALTLIDVQNHFGRNQLFPRLFISLFPDPVVVLVLHNTPPTSSYLKFCDQAVKNGKFGIRFSFLHKSICFHLKSYHSVCVCSIVRNWTNLLFGKSFLQTGIETESSGQIPILVLFLFSTAQSHLYHSMPHVNVMIGSEIRKY